MTFLNRCCVNCKDGEVIPHWTNITMVRPPGDTLGPHYTSAPYPRYDTGIYNTENPGAGCTTLPLGTCGIWLTGGDLGGLSVQEINTGTNDIQACAAEDSTHVTSDHNCYHNAGDTVNMSTPRYGFQSVLARKFWHGTPAWTMLDVCTTPNLNAAPYDTKYLTVTANVAYAFSDNSAGGIEGELIEKNMTLSGSCSVDRYSGKVSNTISSVEDDYDSVAFYNDTSSPPDPSLGKFWVTYQTKHASGGAGWVYDNVATPYAFGDTYPQPPLASLPQITYTSGLTAGLDYLLGADVHCGFTVSIPSSGAALADFVGEWNDEAASLFATFGNYDYKPLITAVTDPNNYGPVDTGNFTSGGPSGPTARLQLSWSRSDTGYAWNYSYTETQTLGSFVYNLSETFSGILTLSNPYTAAECYTDLMNAFAAWDMSDLNLASLRTDEELALSPLVIYDEIGPSSPLGNPPTTTDNYSGDIIAHNQPGSDRHFWFGYTKLKREFDSTEGKYEWFFDTHGGQSESPLPPVTMRWLDHSQAQYDAVQYIAGGGTPPPGNFPWAWLDHRAGVLTGGKYVVATQKWPAVNLGRPCGPDKYAMDQQTVCCVSSWTTVSGFYVFTVNTTGNAIAPGATGGLQINDYIMTDAATAGVYQISAITGTGPWTITLSAKLDDPPTGYAMQEAGDRSDGSAHIGCLRFFQAATGICGRVAITTSFAGGTVTITPAVAQPYLRLDPAAIEVDIYDASMTLLASGVSLTRGSDTSFTVVTSAMPTAAWMTSREWITPNTIRAASTPACTWNGRSISAWPRVLPTWPRSSPQLIPPLRAAQTAYEAAYGSYPPTWYAGVGGCTGNPTREQFTYPAGACPAFVGIVPSYSGGPGPLESFPAQQLYYFPSTFTLDDLCGSHWQAMTALTMQDPFWQQPFKPNCDAATFTWTEDNGSGMAVDTVGGTPSIAYFAHHPLVEALMTVPSGDSLPSGITLYYDSSNQIAPQFYPNGIPIGDTSGNYGSFETDWGFAAVACANIAGGTGRFRAIYATFVSC